MLRRAGYNAGNGRRDPVGRRHRRDLCPPALGAAAFLIAEFLHITYLKVIVMATIPTLLYYLSIFLMIEADSRRAGRDAPGRLPRRRSGS